MPPLTRGPLPAGVYWRRRLFVLLLAATLVFVIANVLGGGSDAKDDDVPAAQQAGGVEASQTITVKDRRQDRKKDRRVTGGQQGPSYDPAVMADPDGNCDPADVRITPRIEAAVAGEPVTVGLSLQTVQAEACYFRIGADKVTVKVTKGDREVWTSRECPDPVPDESVVVRRVVATVVQMTWTPYPQGRRGAECPGTDDWLMPGAFTATAAALGGEPADSDFVLASPTPETITVSPDPKKKDRKNKQDRDPLQGESAQEEAQGDQPEQQASDRSTDEPRR
ncbi:hypothetical protein [Nocardioides bizhenqiangii]|uniref:DUF4232 domain-containing protein n=1 Tax=Nocardioides bizhenqiangii TaxID=3095076 RepID=A0ABZ0ZTV2_9ACTN|nr:hypothetical protein [Nocardioides sp. HM61]WQQ26933.1 hypothetical protein SHK19_01575 [Nocardioides sp. HM61]